MPVKISSKYQVVIPEEARKSLDLIPGSLVDVVVKGGVAYLVPLKTIEELKKGMKGKLTANDVKTVRDKTR